MTGLQNALCKVTLVLVLFTGLSSAVVYLSHQSLCFYLFIFIFFFSLV